MSRPGVRVREIDSRTIQLVAETGAGEVAFHVELPADLAIRGKLEVTVWTRHGFGDHWRTSDELARRAAPILRRRVAQGGSVRAAIVAALEATLLEVARSETN
jgi:hypothetical protein